MHIAILSDPSSFHTQKWAQGLRRAGADVTVFSFRDGAIEGVPCVRVAPPRGLGKKLNYAWYLYGTGRLRAALEAHRVDVVNPLNVTPYGVWAARSGFRPVVSTAMGTDVLMHAPEITPALRQRNKFDFNAEESQRFFYRAKLRLARRFFRHHVHHALHASALVTGDNRVLVDAVVDWFGVPRERVRLNRWGVEPELFETTPERLRSLREAYGIQPGQAVIASPRGMLPPYQADVILEGFRKLLGQGRADVKCLQFSAGYPVPASLKAQALSLETEHDAFFFQAGKVSREEMHALWHLIDLFVSAPIYDGYSNAVGEGRFAGAVPVVNRTPATLELFEHQRNGWMVEPFTPDNLARALTEILADLPRWKAAFAETNRAWILEHAHLATNCRLFVQWCRDVLANHR